jgi:hypothetical protein
MKKIHIEKIEINYNNYAQKIHKIVRLITNNIVRISKIRYEKLIKNQENEINKQDNPTKNQRNILDNKKYNIIIEKERDMNEIYENTINDNNETRISEKNQTTENSDWIRYIDYETELLERSISKELKSTSCKHTESAEKDASNNNACINIEILKKINIEIISNAHKENNSEKLTELRKNYIVKQNEIIDIINQIKILKDNYNTEYKKLNEKMDIASMELMNFEKEIKKELIETDKTKKRTIRRSKSLTNNTTKNKEHIPQNVNESLADTTKNGRGRPKGALNKPKAELQTDGPFKIPPNPIANRRSNKNTKTVIQPPKLILTKNKNNNEQNSEIANTSEEKNIYVRETDTIKSYEDFRKEVNNKRKRSDQNQSNYANENALTDHKQLSSTFSLSETTNQEISESFLSQSPIHDVSKTTENNNSLNSTTSTNKERRRKRAMHNKTINSVEFNRANYDLNMDTNNMSINQFQNGDTSDIRQKNNLKMVQEHQEQYRLKAQKEKEEYEKSMQQQMEEQRLRLEEERRKLQEQEKEMKKGDDDRRQIQNKLVITLKNLLMKDQLCCIQLQEELNECLKIKNEVYEAYFLNEYQFIFKTDNIDLLRYVEKIENWDRIYNIEISNIAIAIENINVSAILRTKFISQMEEKYLKDKYKIVNIRQLGKSSAFKADFIDTTTRDQILNMKVIQVACKKIPIEEFREIRVRQCAKCQSLEHKSNDCTKNIKCKYCSEAHYSSQCTMKEDETKYKCSNCVENSNHRSDDKNKCILFKKAFEEAQKKEQMKNKEQTDDLKTLRDEIKKLNVQIIESGAMQIKITKELLNADNEELSTSEVLEKIPDDTIIKPLKEAYSKINKKQ